MALIYFGSLVWTQGWKPSSRSSAKARSFRLHLDCETSLFLLRKRSEKTGGLKESVVGVEFFGKAPGYDPKRDPIVRVEAYRLRRRLAEYYAKDGAGNEWRIDLPKGNYVPVIKRANAQPDPLRLAVFVEAGDTLTSQGLTVELISKLGSLTGISVIAPHSSLVVHSVSAAVQALGANAVLECRLHGTSLRARLSRAKAAGLEPIGFFDNVIQPAADALTVFVACTLRVGDMRSHAPKARSALMDRESYQIYLAGRAWFHRWSPDNLDQAAAKFEQVIGRYPDYAPALSGLADCQVLRAYWHTGDTRATLEQGRDLANRALGADPHCHEAYCSRAAFKAALDCDWAGSETDFLRALQGNPNDALALNWLSIICLVPQGRFEEAIDNVFTAYDLDPVSPEISNEVVGCAFCAASLRRRRNKASESLSCILEGYWSLGLAQAAVGAYSGAMEAFEIAERLAPDVPFTIAWKGLVAGLSGNQNEGNQCLQRLRAVATHTPLRDLYFAYIYAGMSDSEPAMDYLEAAFNAADPHSRYLEVCFWYDSLRQNPRFDRLKGRLLLSSKSQPAGTP
jgi:tetratricopeptide (TPR) repeat protein